MLKYRYFVVVESSALGAVCRDLGPLQLAYYVCWWVVSIPPPPGHRPTPTSLPSASSKHTVRPCRGDYRYRPARHHVTVLWRDSTQCVGKAWVLGWPQVGMARSSKGLNTLCVLSAQSRTRSSDIALLRRLKQCSADREYTYWATLAQYAKTQSRTNASDIAHFVRIV